MGLGEIMGLGEMGLNHLRLASSVSVRARAIKSTDQKH